MSNTYKKGSEYRAEYNAVIKQSIAIGKREVMLRNNLIQRATELCIMFPDVKIAPFGTIDGKTAIEIKMLSSYPTKELIDIVESIENQVQPNYKQLEIKF